MKKRDLTELKNKNSQDLSKKVKDLQKELTNSILELKMGKIKNVHTGNSKRKDIARILTFLNIKTQKEKAEKTESKKTKIKE
jgi:ribosomal protein L29